jgi:hypothetical protein
MPLRRQEPRAQQFFLIMTTDAQRRAVAAHALRLKKQGWRFLSVRLSPESMARLDALKDAHGSYRAAIEYLLSK